MAYLGALDYIMIILGVVFLIVWMIFYIIGWKHNSLFATLSEKDYPLKEVYGLGYGILETFKYKYKSKSDVNLRKELDVLYGSKYSEYYLRVVHAQQITISLTLLVVSFILYGISSEITAFVVGVAFAVLAYYYFANDSKEKILDRSNEILRNFPEIVSNLALLTNAGMILREAWEEVASAGDSIIYKEMKVAVDEMNNGIAEVDAIYNFGSRCIIPEVKKFVSTIIQGINEGNTELIGMLQQQSREVWQLKQQIVRRDGAKAASKLMIPICLMFIGILIMIMVPIFTNLGV